MLLDGLAGWQIYIIAVVFQYIRYVVIVGAIHLTFWVLLKKWTEKRQVSQKRFTNADIRRELKASFWFVCAVSVPVSFLAMPEYIGYTKLYFNLSDYPLWWPPLSFVVLLLGQDAYFYWTHRLMHSPMLFKSMHSTHHTSMYPSAFAAFAMHPSEAIVASGFNLFMVLLVPMHFQTFMVYQLVQLLLNVYGHLGADPLPDSWRSKPILKHLNRTPAHAGHHKFYTVNFGLYFTFWDRWMGTFDERTAPIDAPMKRAQA